MRLGTLSVVMVALALAATGCGASNPEVSIVDASERTQAEETARLDMSASVKTPKGSLEMQCDGVADYVRKRSRWTCDFSSLGRSEMITIGSVNYFRAGTRPPVTPPEKPWTKTTLDESPDEMHGFRPATYFALLRSASSEIEKVGEEQVRGVPTVHYRLTVDPAKAGSRASKDPVPVDVWIDAEQLVRRIDYDVDEARTRVEFYDFGVPVEIEPPPADQVEDLDVVRVNCAGGQTTPITEEQALAALRHHGINAYPDPTGCGGAEDIAIELTNVLFEGPHENIEEHDEITAHEGHVGCSLRHRPIYGGGTEIRKEDEDRKTWYVLANLECTIFPEGPRTEEQLTALEDALEDLRRQLL